MPCALPGKLAPSGITIEIETAIVDRVEIGSLTEAIARVPVLASKARSPTSTEPNGSAVPSVLTGSFQRLIGLTAKTHPLCYRVTNRLRRRRISQTGDVSLGQ